MRAFHWLTMPRLLAALTLAGVFAMSFRASVDTDTYWHLRAGEWQVEHRQLLATDVFSFTRQGQPWLNVHWLSQLLIYAAYSAFGDAGLALFTALMATAAMVFILAVCEGDPLLRSIAILLAAAAAAVFWSARSQMLSFLFSAIVIYVLWLYQKKSKDRLWLIPLIMIPWANAHGGFAIGFILIALAIGGELAQAGMTLAQKAAGEQNQIRLHLRSALRLTVVGLVSALAVLVNPFGVGTLLLPFRTVGIGVLRDLIQEWAAPNFHLPQMWPFAALLLGTLAAAGLSSRRLDMRDAVMLAGTGGLALLAGRNISTFALVAAPVLTVHLQSLLDNARFSLNTSRMPSGGIYAVMNWILLLLVLAGVAGKVAVELSPQRREQLAKEILPVDAVAYLRADQPPRELFNSYNWGGYLIWAARDYPVYVDGRTDLYDDAFIRDYLHIYYAQLGWDSRLDAARINTVLVESSSPLAQVLSMSPGWEKAYSDPLAVIYVRKTPIGK